IASTAIALLQTVGMFQMMGNA
ncbi:MAG: hypothetical protein RJB62_1077, partial [Pseudomonadota bacterium]